MGEDAIKVVEMLKPTNLRILRLLSEERLDVSTTAERLELSEPYVSEQIHILEELKLIKVDYEPGKKGIRKLCQTAVKKITIVIKPEV